MNFLCFIVLCLLLSVNGSRAVDVDDGKISIPEKCDDVLSVKVCEKLKSIAATLKLKYTTVKEAVVNAVQSGKQSADDIIGYVKNFYLEKIKDKKCEDFIKTNVCQELYNTAHRISIQAKEVHHFVKQALVEGKKTVVEVSTKVNEYFKNKYANKSCEEILDRTVFRIVQVRLCESLRKSATAVKVGNNHLRTIITETIIKGVNGTRSFMKDALSKVKEISATITTCENILNEKLCETLRTYANKTRVAFPKIMSTVRDLLLTGVRVAKGFVKFVYKITDAFIDCEDVFTEKSCGLLKEKIAKIGGTISDTGKVVREIATKFAGKVSDTYKVVVEYTKSKLCKYLKLKCPTQGPGIEKNKIAKRSASVSELLTKYKNMLSVGIQEAKKKLEESLKGIADSAKIVDKVVRDIIAEAIADGKGKYKEIKELLNKIVGTITGTSNSTSDKTLVKRDLHDQLKSALQHAHEDLKAAIEYLLTFTKTQLAKIKDYVNTLLSKVMKDTRNKRDNIDENELNKVSEKIADDLVAEATKEATEISERLLDNAVSEISENISIDVLTNKNKRDLGSTTTSTKRFITRINDNLESVLVTLRSRSVDNIKQALKEGGLKIIEVAEEIFNNIQRELDMS